MTTKKQEKRIRLKRKIRAKIFGTSTYPRLSVFRSNRFIYAQLIDDEKRMTLAQASDMQAKGTKSEGARATGASIAKQALEKKVTKCVFDRNGFNYTGRIKILADEARANGLKF